MADVNPEHLSGASRLLYFHWYMNTGQSKDVSPQEEIQYWKEILPPEFGRLHTYPWPRCQLVSSATNSAVLEAIRPNPNFEGNFRLVHAAYCGGSTSDTGWGTFGGSSGHGTSGRNRSSITDEVFRHFPAIGCLNWSSVVYPQSQMPHSSIFPGSFKMFRTRSMQSKYHHRRGF
eukprot:gb/GECG01009733.1/.p1 GENE.gb/GECG01009733.1/~~gb/GECG01009733.1/.p1  ORF type:complete len:174 (+),score=7.91 gb/GECG01009733.1/:1-522(+)